MPHSLSGSPEPRPKGPRSLHCSCGAHQDVGEVFSQQRALSLPPHQAYDFCIDLLPRALLLSSRLYNLSRPEGEVMEKYIDESLTAGSIQPIGLWMTSPSRTGIPYPCLTLLLVPAIVPGSSLNSTFGRPTICGPATSGGMGGRPPQLCVPVIGEWCSLCHVEQVCLRLHWRHPHRFEDKRGTMDRLVLQHILETRLLVKVGECDFHLSPVSFLGFVVQQVQLTPGPTKVSVVAEWQTSSSRKRFLQFLSSF